MKKVMLIMLILCPIIMKAQFLSYTISDYKINKILSVGFDSQKDTSVVIKELWISPSVNLDLFILEAITEKSFIGITPGAGYGIRYNPKWFNDLAGDIFKCLISLDIYVQGNLSKDSTGYDYFNIDILPSITILDWVSVGFGHRWKIKQRTEFNSFDTNLISFGIRKSI